MTTEFTLVAHGRQVNHAEPPSGSCCRACKGRALFTVAGTGVCVDCALSVAQIAAIAHQRGTSPAGLIARIQAAICAGIGTDAGLFIDELSAVAGRHPQ